MNFEFFSCLLKKVEFPDPKIFRLLTQNSNYLEWDKSFGNKINIDLDEVITQIKKVGESELTDEPWEQILWGVSQQDPYLKVTIFNVLELFNFLRELFENKKEGTTANPDHERHEPRCLQYIRRRPKHVIKRRKRRDEMF